MKHTTTLLLSLLFSVSSLYSTTFQVGPQRDYSFPSQVIDLVQAGDIVEIDAGVYLGDVGIWATDDLTIRGVGGMAHMRANGANAQGKAIWVIAGNNVTLENIEFSEASVPDHNGAGIRAEGENLTVRHCYFHDNETGILAGDNSESVITVEFSEFANNGYGDGFTHHIYVNRIFRLTVRFCYMHHAIVGHHIKSRARFSNILYNRIMDEATGNSSYLIELANGGMVTIMGNLLMQGPNAENKALVAYGTEEYPFEYMHRLFIFNNSMVNERSTGSFLFMNGFLMGSFFNNILAGPGVVMETGGVEETNNLRLENIGDANFIDADNFDYQLSADASAINAAIHPGSMGATWFPDYQYVHPTDSVARPTDGPLDIGAYEFPNATSIFTPNSSLETVSVNISPNPVGAEAWLQVRYDQELYYEIYASDGRKVERSALFDFSLPLRFDAIHLRTGIYFIVFKDEVGQLIGRSTFWKQ